MTYHKRSININYLTDQTFNRVNRLFVPLFENEGDRKYFSNCYAPSVEIEDFNVLIDGKSFFDVSIKSEEETYKKIIEMSKNND